MKRILFLTAMLILLPAVSWSQLTHAGIMGGYATEVKEPGFGLVGMYRVNDQIKITPNALWYLPHEINTANGSDILEGIQKFEWYMFNMDGNYVIMDRGTFEGYGMMGLNFAHLRWLRDENVLGQPEKERRKITKLGLNVGAGIRLKLGEKVSPFAEIKYTLGSKSDFLVTEVSTSMLGISAGVLIRISEDKDRTYDEEY